MRDERRGSDRGAHSDGDPESSRLRALHQSLASCGAVTIALIGFTHEVAGHLIFPWGPDLLGGPIGWHATGLLAVATGLLLLGGTLRLIRFPVIPVALTTAAASVFFFVIAAALHQGLPCIRTGGLLSCPRYRVLPSCLRRSKGSLPPGARHPECDLFDE